MEYEKRWPDGRFIRTTDHTTGEDYYRNGCNRCYTGDSHGWYCKLCLRSQSASHFTVGLLAGILIGAGLTCAIWMWL